MKPLKCAQNCVFVVEFNLNSYKICKLTQLGLKIFDIILWFIRCYVSFSVFCLFLCTQWWKNRLCLLHISYTALIVTNDGKTIKTENHWNMDSNRRQCLEKLATVVVTFETFTPISNNFPRAIRILTVTLRVTKNVSYITVLDKYAQCF